MTLSREDQILLVLEELERLESVPRLQRDRIHQMHLDNALHWIGVLVEERHKGEAVVLGQRFYRRVPMPTNTERC
jgi:hypothetical protein